MEILIIKLFIKLILINPSSPTKKEPNGQQMTVGFSLFLFQFGYFIQMFFNEPNVSLILRNLGSGVDFCEWNWVDKNGGRIKLWIKILIKYTS